MRFTGGARIMQQLRLLRRRFRALPALRRAEFALFLSSALLLPALATYGAVGAALARLDGSAAHGLAAAALAASGHGWVVTAAAWLVPLVVLCALRRADLGRGARAMRLVFGGERPCRAHEQEEEKSPWNSSAVSRR
jgi:hypothetical protein